MLTIGYFAWVRDAMECGGETLARDPAWRSIGDLVDFLATRDDRGARAFADRSRIRAAIGNQMAAFDSVLPEGGEVSLFPPMTGG
jgi:molybdopterin synthase sulfur carrier subunit